MINDRHIEITRYLVNDVEGVQRSITKRMSGLKTCLRLAKLGIDSLERRRL